VIAAFQWQKPVFFFFCLAQHSWLALLFLIFLLLRRPSCCSVAPFIAGGGRRNYIDQKVKDVCAADRRRHIAAGTAEEGADESLRVAEQQQSSPLLQRAPLVLLRVRPAAQRELDGAE
jgi:hypothetical protein